MNAPATQTRASAGRRGRPQASRNGHGTLAATARDGRQRGRGGARRAQVRGETPKARGERTRQRVGESLVELLAEGDPAPTAKAVAARAGVSVRLVFHHFEDMDSLYRMVMTMQAERYWDAVRPVPPDLPLGDRIDQTVLQRAKLFDAIGPVRRASSAIAARDEDIAERIAGSDARLRSWLEAAFARELRASGRERRELLSAVDTAASWEAWDRLRRAERLSAAASRRVMARTLRSLLG
jgi:TetR/AcrR family transcriptional regulator, regulator of autoinduction and epiphytic fitness